MVSVTSTSGNLQNVGHALIATFGQTRIWLGSGVGTEHENLQL